jgi:hypothetical protein
MAAVTALKKDLRRKIKKTLAEVSDASAASQSRSICPWFLENGLMLSSDRHSFQCHRSAAGNARV